MGAPPVILRKTKGVSAAKVATMERRQIIATLSAAAVTGGFGAAIAGTVNRLPIMVGAGSTLIIGGVLSLLGLLVTADRPTGKGVRINSWKRDAAVAAASEASGAVTVALHVYDYPDGANLAHDIRDIFERAGWKVSSATRDGVSGAKSGITVQTTRDGASTPQFDALKAALNAAGISWDVGTEPASNTPGVHAAIYVGRPRS